MDRKLEIAEMRVADLEFQVMDLDAKLQHYRDNTNHLEKVVAKLNDDRKSFLDTFDRLGLIDANGNIITDEDDITALKDGIRRAKHLEVFEAANRENPIINDAWNKYLMALRLCGLDNNESSPA